MKRIGMNMAALLAAAISLPFLAAGQQPKQDAKKVEGVGCVEAGVEAGCLIVKDIKSGKVFNLMVREPRPRVGEGIEFAGTLFRGVTTCMQGTAVQVASWQPRNTLKCVPGVKK